MRQSVEDLCHWDNTSDPDINYQPNSPSMDSNIDDINSKKFIHQSSSVSSITTEQSATELLAAAAADDDDDDDNNQSSESTLKHNYTKYRRLEVRRKNSDSSDTSSLSDTTSSSSSSSSSSQCDSINNDDNTINIAKFNDIIEKIVELKFSPNDKHKSVDLNECNNVGGDVNANYKDHQGDDEKVNRVKKGNEYSVNDVEVVEDSDNELRARGPLRPQSNQCRKKPYQPLDDWLETSAQMQNCTTDIDIQQILNNREYSERINPCLDRLEHNGWSISNQDSGHGSNWDDGISIPSIPSITVNENSLTGEELLMEILDLKGFQSAQSDATSNANPSPAASSENWPDSPASLASYNVLSSRSHSRASSRAQSPGSSANIGSPLVPISMVGSPEALSRFINFRAPIALSSSSSSNHSYSDIPSPSNYLHTIDGRVDDQLGRRFRNFSTWCETCENYESSGTIVNSTEIVDDIDNRLQLVEEVIKNDLELQVVPKYNPQDQSAIWRCRMRNKIAARTHSQTNGIPPTNSTSPINQHSITNVGNNGTIINTPQNHLNYTQSNDTFNTLSYDNNIQQSGYTENSVLSTQATMNFDAELENFFTSNYSKNNNDNQYYASDINESMNNFMTGQNTEIIENNTPSTSGVNDEFYNNWSETSNTTFNNFQIPKPVSTFKQPPSKRTIERNIAPWPSLNLPLTEACKRLKEGLDPKEVEKAMKNLLKKSPTELAMADVDGDTMLMCLVGNPVELQQKKAYLVPLVERLGTLGDALSKMNNRGEDALYLAAINCSQMPYITGYLGAVMLQKGIDISQRLYQTRGDTLIHAVAANGDSHMHVLAELLSLKTTQGNAVFDLSKCNYDGRTPLHVAVEAHNPTGSGVNSIGTVQLLLEHRADPKIKEIKCGNTALHLAVSLFCEPVLVEALLSSKGHEAVNIPNRNNNTPLHMAAAISDRISLEKQANVCANLIRAGGLTNIINDQGKTPLALVSVERKDYIRNIFRKKI